MILIKKSDSCSHPHGQYLCAMGPHHQHQEDQGVVGFQSPSIVIRSEKLEVVSQFKFLGSRFTSDRTIDAEIANRVASANAAFARLLRPKVWTSEASS